MDRLHELLQESILCYREMLSVYGRIRENIASGGCPEVLESFLSAMQELNARAQHADARFQERILQTGTSPNGISMFSEWKNLLARVREENLQIQRYIKVAMASIHEDLNRLKHGKKALSGYRSGQDARGRKIDTYST